VIKSWHLAVLAAATISSRIALGRPMRMLLQNNQSHAPVRIKKVTRHQQGKDDRRSYIRDMVSHGQFNALDTTFFCASCG
jgi:hypothetical protein